MKNLKNLVVVVLVVLAMVSFTACSSAQNEVVTDDIQIVSLDASVTQYDNGVADVYITAVVSVMASSVTRVDAAISMDFQQTREYSAPIFSTGGHSATFSATFLAHTGTSNVKCVATLVSTGKTVEKTIQVVVK